MKNSSYRAARTSIAGEITNWRGYWITSYRFYHLQGCHCYGHDRKPQFNSEIQNVHTLFKKNFTLKEAGIKKARLFITGDDLYKLYVNSDFVGEGPAQSYPFSYNYNCFDVTDLLRGGENSIGVHVYYQGLFNIYLLSADNLCGMILQLEVEYENGECETVVSDGSWIYSECEAYSARHIYGYQTQFSEDIDFNRIDPDWTSAQYDAGKWSRVSVAAKPYPMEYNLVAQNTPTVEHYPVYPKSITNLENGYLFDFGEELVGRLSAIFCGAGGDTVEIRCGEELLENGRVRYELRANCNYSDLITLSGREDKLDYFDYKGYRYAEILNPPENFNPSTVFTECRHYPFPKRSAAFRCSDSVLNGIWDICARGVRIGTQDTYYDCPTREKGGFVGDALITGLSHLILTADTRIYEKFITDLKNTSRYCPAIMAHLPTYDINIVSDYSSLVPLFLLEYYRYTGDKDLVKEMLPVAEGVWDYYSRFLNEDFLLEDIRHMDKVPEEMQMILIDWPQNLRDGYDMDKALHGISTTVNTFFYGFHKTTAALYRIVGDTERAKQAEEIYTAMGESIIKQTYCEEKGIFRDTPDSEHSALHANALQLFFGLTPPRGYAPIVELIKERGLNCGVYFAYFVIKGLYDIGEHELAYELLSGDGEHSWSNMLKSGATTCMEAWGPDQKWNTSWCHPWSSSPIYFITSEIMGIKPKTPGFSELEISPRIPPELDYAEIEIPIQKGVISASFKRGADGIDYTVSVPEGIKTDFSGDGIKFTRR